MGTFLHLKTQMYWNTFTFSSLLNTSYALILSKVSIYMQSYFQYYSANGSFISWNQFGLSWELTEYFDFKNIDEYNSPINPQHYFCNKNKNQQSQRIFQNQYQTIIWHWSPKIHCVQHHVAPFTSLSHPFENIVSLYLNISS